MNLVPHFDEEKNVMSVETNDFIGKVRINVVIDENENFIKKVAKICRNVFFVPIKKGFQLMHQAVMDGVS